MLCSGKIFSQVKIDATGNVGIGITSPTTKFHVYGNTIINPDSWTGGIIIDKSGLSSMPTIKPSSPWYASLGTAANYFGYSYVKQMSSQTCLTETLRSNSHINNYGYVFSDAKIKTNITDIQKPFELLMKLQGKKYDMLAPSVGLVSNNAQKEKKNEYGYIAQDFITVFPELVIFDTITNLYAINYTGLIPIIVEALKEQKEINNEQLAELNNLKTKSTEKSAFIDETKSAVFNEVAILNQNIPNPFTQNTRIDIFLPQTIGKAAIYVYNMQGVQIKTFTINERGNTSLVIEGGSLKAGMYLYSLIADGKEVATKKMILTK